MALQAFLAPMEPFSGLEGVERTVFRQRGAEAEAERFLHSTKSWGA